MWTSHWRPCVDNTLCQCEAPEGSDDFSAERDEELKRLEDNETYEEVSREQAQKEGLKVLKSGWVLTQTGEKRKARFVAKEIAYKRTAADSRLFAATPSVMGLRLILLMAALGSWGALVADISSAFVNALLPEQAKYAVEAPEERRNEGYVWRLRKALYGLRGAPKYWQEHVGEVPGRAGLRAVNDR